MRRNTVIVLLQGWLWGIFETNLKILDDISDWKLFLFPANKQHAGKSGIRKLEKRNELFYEIICPIHQVSFRVSHTRL